MHWWNSKIQKCADLCMIAHACFNDIYNLYVKKLCILHIKSDFSGRSKSWTKNSFYKKCFAWPLQDVLKILENLKPSTPVISRDLNTSNLLGPPDLCISRCQWDVSLLVSDQSYAFGAADILAASNLADWSIWPF